MVGVMIAATPPQSAAVQHAPHVPLQQYGRELSPPPD
jgi:hypothetical protein